MSHFGEDMYKRFGYPSRAGVLHSSFSRLGFGSFYQLECVMFVRFFILALLGTRGAFEDLRVSLSRSSTNIGTSLVADFTGENTLLSEFGNLLFYIVFLLVVNPPF